MNTSWLFGGVDMERWLEFKAAQPQQFGEFMQRGRERLRLCDKPFVSWRNDIALFMGPRLVGVKKVLRAQWASGDAFDDEIGETGCSPAAGTSPATPTRIPLCARSRSAGSPARRPGRLRPWPRVPELHPDY
jgi:hypothetical protein